MLNTVLIIGNGFDVYHGFPTKYMDFLKFISNSYSYYDGNKADFDRMEDGDNINVPIKSLVNVDREKIVGIDDLTLDINKDNKCILTAKEENFWIRHFLRIVDELNDKWIDFEKEIGNVLSVVKDFFDNIFFDYLNDSSVFLYDSPYRAFFEIYNTMDKELLLKKGVEELSLSRNKAKLKNRYHSKQRVKELENRVLDYLRDELVALKKCLFWYMESIVSRLNTSVHSEQLVKFRSVYVLNFNYTNFYPNIYHNQIIEEIHPVHGDLKNENIVLGTTRDETKEIEPGYLYFEKYFQRLQNRTGFKYRNWIKETNSIIDEEFETIIAGHSLDEIDMDLLKQFFINDKVRRIRVLYHSQLDFEEKLINLIKVFEKTNIEKWMGDKRLVFEEWEKAIK